MQNVIRFENLSISLDKRILFNNINLEIKKGDKFMFLGPNGVGKSLLLELLILGNSREMAKRYKGLKVSGHIFDENGNDMLDPSVDRNISYVSQSEDFYEKQTIKDLCETACHGVGIELDEKQLDDYLKSFDIYEKKNKKIKNNVSFGEGKIVHIISRLLKLKNSNILILDEPLNHLSFKNSKVFNDLMIKEIDNNPELTVIMVSHCRAMSFAKEALVYSVSDKIINIMPYKSYDCFEQ